MTIGNPLIEDLAIVLCVAAATSVLCHKLRQPTLLGYMLAGLIVGPHTPFPLFADEGRIHTLSELGVILVMFCIGLEFSVRRLVRLVPSAGIICLIQVFTMLWLGYLGGQAMGFTVIGSVFTGATLAISSTMVVARVFTDQHIGGLLAERAYGILIMEDIVAVLLLAGLTALGAGSGLSADLLLPTLGKLAAFLAVLVAVGFLLVPRTVRYLARQREPEMLLVASMGLCFAFALVAQELGYSVALGAFLAGSLAAESGEPARVLRLVAPLRDVFAAVFFVSVGMSVDPHLIAAHWVAVLLLTVLVIVGKVLSVSIGAFLAGTDVRGSVQTGLSLAHIGEFSFIMATLGYQSGAVGPELLPIIVAVATITTFLTPPMVRASERVALAVDRRLPRRMQTFVTLYGSWLEGLREPARRNAVRAQTRRLATLLVLDMALLSGIVIAASLAQAPLAAWLTERVARHTEVGPVLARWLVPVAALVAALPFLIGIVRCVRGLGARLAFVALPAARPGTTDFAAAPRRALVVCVQLLLMLVVVVPLLAVTQPFVPTLSGAPVLLLVVVAAGLAFWRSATNLQEHVVAGAQMVVEALATGVPGAPDGPVAHAAAGHEAGGHGPGGHGASPHGPSAADGHGLALDDDKVPHGPGPSGTARAPVAAPAGMQAAAPLPPLAPAVSMEEVERLLPGIGSLRRVGLAPEALAVGRSLRELNLRGLTGATVLAIARGGRPLIAPDGHEVLRAGDILALTGTHQAIDAAEALLVARPAGTVAGP